MLGIKLFFHCKLIKILDTMQINGKHTLYKINGYLDLNNSLKMAENKNTQRLNICIISNKFGAVLVVVTHKFD